MSGASGEHVSQVRMPRAVCLTEAGRPMDAIEAVGLRDLRKDLGQAPPKFKCLYCRAALHPVHAERTETRRASLPFFARNPSPKAGPPNTHDLGCKFAVDRIIKNIQAASDGALTSHLEEGVRIYRLSLPATFVRPTAGEGELSAEYPSEREFVERNFTVLNTAVKVTQMLADLQRAGATIEAEFRAFCHGAEVKWLDFMYTRRRLITLARRIELNGEPTHPIAAIINPSTPAPKRARWAPYDWWIKAGMKQLDGYQGPGRSIFIYAPDPSWLPTPSARGWVAYGMWSLSPSSKYDDSLCLTLPDSSCIAPLPEDISPNSMDAWGNADTLRWARAYSGDQYET